MRIDIKPMSVNEAWQGRRYKTPKYKEYRKDVLWLLPKCEIPKGDLHIDLSFGVSSKLADWDNPIKPFVDILQEKYDFNDKRIVSACVKKELVKKGEEYIEFDITSH